MIKPDPVSEADEILDIVGRTPICALDYRITNTGIHNLSKVVLGSDDRKLLGKGHKFIPRPRRRSEETLWEALAAFQRRIRLRFKHGIADSNPTQPNGLPALFVNHPEYQPPPTNPTIEKYLGECEKHLRFEVLRNPPAPDKPNVTIGERFALHRWAGRKDVVLKPADKNLGLTVTDVEWYDKQVKIHLENKESFTPLSEVQAWAHVDRASEKVKAFSEFMDKRTAKYINQHLSKKDPLEACPHFYLTIKVHKSVPCGRPIVAAHSYVTTPLSFFLSKCLEPVVFKLDRFVRNSADVCKLVDTLSREVPTGPPSLAKNLWYVTGDVESLYPNVDIDYAVQVFSKYVDRITPSRRLQRELIKALDVVLRFNVVQYDSRFYLQIRGVAMGTPMAPYLASLYMHHLEDSISPAAGIRLWKRYIDDIIVVFTGEEKTLVAFMDAYAKLHPLIKVNWVKSQLRCEFLDLYITHDDDSMYYRTHQKVFNKYLYIPKSSFHTQNQLKSWINGELTRYARTCSREEDYRRMRIVFQERLLRRGYNGKFLRHVFSGHAVTKTEERRGTREPDAGSNPNRMPNATHTPVTAFVLPYNPSYLGLKIRNCLASGEAFVEASSRYPEIIGNPTIAWKREPNLGNSLLRAKYRTNAAHAEGAERPPRARSLSLNNKMAKGAAPMTSSASRNS